jgi:hypothetical protein
MGLDPEYLNDVKGLSKTMMEGLSKTTGEYLHNLYEKKPNKKAAPSPQNSLDWW